MQAEHCDVRSIRQQHKSEKGEFKIIRNNSKKNQNIGDFHLTNRHLFVIIIWYEFLEQVYALLAQLDRVAHYECEGWGFESLMAHQKTAEFQQVQRFSFVYYSFNFPLPFCPVFVYNSIKNACSHSCRLQ